MGLADRIDAVESGGDPNARNSRSSAEGPGQFIDETWLATLAKHRPDITGSRDELLALKTDPDLAREMTGAYAADNGNILKQAGLPVTPGTTYLAHFAGPGGAVGLLNADPATPARSILSAAAIEANPFLAKMSAGDVAAWANRKMGGGAAPMSLGGSTAAVGLPSVAPVTSQPVAPQKQQTAAPMSLGGGSPAVDLSALAAVPQLQNILPARPRLALGRNPFSLGG